VLEIDISSPEPVFEQIMSQIGLAIKLNQLKSGDRLPAIRQLANDLEINPNTVARAYLMLEDSGMIETKGRAGSVITESAIEAYDQWLTEFTKIQLSNAWNKLRTLNPNLELCKKIWKQSLKELRDE